MKPKKEGRKPSPEKSKHLLEQLAQTPDKLFTGAFRSQFGALCFRYKDGGEDFEILVITSRDSGRWIIPKGWPMKGKKPYEAAAIEAWEEAGVRGTVRKKPIGRYTYLKDLDDGNVAPCIVEMFQIEVKKVRADFKEKGQRILHWVTPDEAARRVREIELKSLSSISAHRPRNRNSPRRTGRLRDCRNRVANDKIIQSARRSCTGELFAAPGKR